MSPLLISAALLVAAVSGQRYICGTSEYPFYSDISCDNYQLCINGGFLVKGAPSCSDNVTCLQYNTNSVCVGQVGSSRQRQLGVQCCCTIPRIEGVTTTQRFLDQAASAAPILAPVLALTLLINVYN